MKKEKKGLIIVFTGDGKGKTTAALGVALRAAGHNLNTLMIQFMKEKGKSGEQRMCPEVVKNIEIYPFGMGFVFRGDDIRPHMEIAEKAWFFMEEILSQKRYHILILDELAATINLGLLPVERVEELIKRISPNLHVIITGRDVPEELIKMADIVTVMHEAKHIYKEGVGAVEGIDF